MREKKREIVKRKMKKERKKWRESERKGGLGCFDQWISSC